MKLKLSALIITYNQAEYISQAIDGILMQETNFEFELIIANDCSPDNTDEIIRNYIDTHPKASCIKYFRHPKNIGMMHNFAFALKECKGEYIAICEGDDYWTDPQKLQKQVDVMEQNPDVVITYHDACKVDANRNIIEKGMLSENRKRDFSADELKTGIWVLMQSMCVRNVIKEYPKSFYKVYNGDTFYTSLIGNYGRGMYIHDIKPTCYRVHQEGIWSMKTTAERKIRSLLTPAELMFFYKAKGDLKFFNYFKDRTQKAIMSMFEFRLPLKYKWHLLKFIFSYSPYLGLRNVVYYTRKTIFN